MNFSSEIKREILAAEEENACCRVAFLSAFVRTSGSLKIKGRKMGFEVTTESAAAARYAADSVRALFGVEPKILEESEDRLSGRKKIVFECVNDRTPEALAGLGIVEADGGGLGIVRGISKYLVENDCCRRAYIRGAFVGGGSCTLPMLKAEGARIGTGYHLEWTFGVYEAAADFAEMLAVYDIFPKLIARKESFVVYLKSNESIGDALALMGAGGCALRLIDLVVTKDVSNNLNRKVNCEMGNLTKQIDASVRQTEAIRLIQSLTGLEAMGAELAALAKARLECPDLTLSGLAEKLGESKSCVNHRMRKIMEIAHQLGGEEHGR